MNTFFDYFQSCEIAIRVVDNCPPEQTGGELVNI